MPVNLERVLTSLSLVNIFIRICLVVGTLKKNMKNIASATTCSIIIFCARECNYMCDVSIMPIRS